MSYVDLLLQAGITIGYVLIFLTIFAESGLLVGFFLPGDSLLITLGLLASRGTLDLTIIILIGCAGAILGDSVGYVTGKSLGKSLFSKKDSKLFKREHLQQAVAFYEKHGKKTIILSRFVPVVRTFAPIVAGAAEMSYKDFLLFNIVGGITWVCSITLLGYFLGASIPNIDHYVLPIIGAIVLFSVLPAAFHLRKSSKKKR